MSSIPEFYNQIAPFYHLIYEDWETSIARQASQIDSLIRENWGDTIHTILDAACGVGTQSIGLAQIGYEVTGSDISPEAIERARREVNKRGLSARFVMADLRDLTTVHHEPFDLVIACDNAIPHLLSDDEIRKAFVEMHHCLRAGGGCVISVRDYDPNESGIKFVPFGIRTDGNTRYVVFQIWEYHSRIYDLSMYFMQDSESSGCKTHVMRSRYYAVPVTRLMELMREADFTDVKRLDDRFFQPVILGRKK